MGNKNVVYLTQEGLDDLKKELDNLINVRRPENIQAIKEARSLGDLSENAEYDAARNEQAQIESRIKQLEKMLENVSIITEVKTDKVGIGNTVSIKYVDDDEEDEYKIVGSQEADPFESKISNESPIAQALFDHKVGDIVTVESQTLGLPSVSTRLNPPKRKRQPSRSCRQRSMHVVRKSGIWLLPKSDTTS